MVFVVKGRYRRKITLSVVVFRFFQQTYVLSYFVGFSLLRVSDSDFLDYFKTRKRTAAVKNTNKTTRLTLDPNNNSLFSTIH
jgi:hypothetical protein